MQRFGVWTPLEANDSLDFHSLSVLGEEFLCKTIPSGSWCPESHRKGTIPSKVFSLSSCTLLLHLFHYQVNLLSNSLAARAGVELDVPGPVGELVSHLLHHLEMFEVRDVNACFKENVRHLIVKPQVLPLSLFFEAHCAHRSWHGCAPGVKMGRKRQQGCAQSPG